MTSAYARCDGCGFEFSGIRENGAFRPFGSRHPDFRILKEDLSEYGWLIVDEGKPGERHFCSSCAAGMQPNSYVISQPKQG